MAKYAKSLVVNAVLHDLLCAKQPMGGDALQGSTPVNGRSAAAGLTGQRQTHYREGVKSVLSGGEAKRWRSNGLSINFYEGLQPYHLNDIMELHADGRFTYQCDEQPFRLACEKTTKTGTWSISADGNEVLFDVGLPRLIRARVIALQPDRVSLLCRHMGLELIGEYQAVA